MLQARITWQNAEGEYDHSIRENIRYTRRYANPRMLFKFGIPAQDPRHRRIELFFKQRGRNAEIKAGKTFFVPPYENALDCALRGGLKII